MSPRRRLVLMVVLSLVAFLVASTGHGRQLRKEREAMGFLAMDPVQGWPPAMHEIWQLDRARLGASTAATAVVAAATVVATGAGVGAAALAMLLWAPTVGFLVAGLLSLQRLWAHDASAAIATLPGMAALYALALLCLGGAIAVARGRRLSTSR